MASRETRASNSIVIQVDQSLAETFPQKKKLNARKSEINNTEKGCAIHGSEIK